MDKRKAKRTQSTSELTHFVNRAVTLGVDTIPELAALIPDTEIQKKIIVTAEHNPFESRKVTIEDLMHEINFLENTEIVE